MVLLFSVLMFCLVLAAATVVGVRCWASPRAVSDRLANRHREEAAPSSSKKWRLDQLAPIFGRVISTSAKERERLTQNLVSAGFRNPNSISVLNGVKVIAAAVLGIGTPAVLAVIGSEPAKIVMGGIVAAAAGFTAPAEFVRMRCRKRRRKIEKALPNALDLLTTCVEAGLGLDQAIVQVSRELHRSYPEISEEFSTVTFETRAGKRRADALRSLAERTGVNELKKLAAVLNQADKFGTSVAQTLRGQSEHLRIQARNAAEEKAAKLGVKMVFPIFFFILPSLFVVTVGPVVVRIVRDLIPMMKNM